MRDSPPRTSFRRYTLRLEWLAAAIGAVLLIAAGAVSLEVLRVRALALQQAESNRVHHHLQVHIQEARQQLRHFLRLPRSLWPGQAPALLPFFSDLYELDDRLQVRQVFKAVPGSRVFAGFSFAGSAISDPLRAGRQRGGGITPIVRGLEDELTSLYVWQQVDGRQLLGRLPLGSIRGFLQRYSAFSGTPTLLVSHDGFILLSGLESLGVATIDISADAGSTVSGRRRGALPPVEIGDRRWLPVVSEESFLGARIVTLHPVDPLAPVRRVLLSAGLLVLVLSGLIFHAKNAQLGRQLFAPLARFAERIHAEEQRLHQGLLPVSGVEADPSGADMRFRELAALHTSFRRLVEAILQRDQALRQVREREQRAEERQRHLLQSQLRSSLLADSVAHEINRPLATILMLCHRASRQLHEGATAIQVAELVDALSLHSQQVSAVIETMRMLLRNVQTEHRPTDPLAVVLGACKSVKPLLRERLVHLELCGVESPPPTVLQGDGVQLQMAVVNLLRLAIDAAAAGTPDDPRLRLSLRADVDELVIEVADNGTGFRVPPDGEPLLPDRRNGSAGLGLFVVRTTLEHHRGRLSIDRCPELGGARFRMHLPLVPGCAAARVSG